MIPDAVQYDLHVTCTCRDGNNSILLRHDDTELAKGAVSAIDLMAAAPELISVALRPVAVTAVAIGDLLAGRLIDPLLINDPHTVPEPLLQI